MITTGSTTLSLLHVALGGSLEGVILLMGGAPRRLFSKFGKPKAAREDPGLRNLNERTGGFVGLIALRLRADSMFNLELYLRDTRAYHNARRHGEEHRRRHECLPASSASLLVLGC